MFGVRNIVKQHLITNPDKFRYKSDWPKQESDAPFRSAQEVKASCARENGVCRMRQQVFRCLWAADSPNASPRQGQTTGLLGTWEVVLKGKPHVFESRSDLHF
jgi:hypothetical protein